MRFGLPCWCAVLIATAPSSLFAANVPVIAVFPIQDSSGNFSPKTLSKLDEYFAAKIAETGRFRVVPHKDLEAQLRTKKAESYNACYDQACQIEIGRELAAEKVLDTKILEIAGDCAVSATIYDLRTSATEGGASVKAGCSEKEVVASIEAVVARLQNPAAGATQPVLSNSTPAPSPEKYTLRVSAQPEDAEVLVDGRAIGKGNASIELERGTSHEVVIERPGYIRDSRRLTLTRDERLDVSLAMTQERQAIRSELFGASVVAGMIATGASTFGIQLRSPSLRFGVISWTLASADLHLVLGSRSMLEPMPPFSSTGSGHLGASFLLETRPSLRFDLTEHDAVQLGLGFGLWAITATDKYIDEEMFAPVVSAGLHYLRGSSGNFQWGLGVRGEFGITSGCGFNASSSDLFLCSRQSPQLVLGEVILGYAD